MRVGLLLAAALLLFLVGRGWSAQTTADGLATLFVRPLSSSSAAVEVGDFSYLLEHSAGESMEFGAHSKASVDLSGIPPVATTIHIGEMGPAIQNEEFVVLWSEEAHFPRLLLNATALTSLQILSGGSHDTLIVHHVPPVFKAHLEIDTGKGNDSIIVDHPLDSDHSLTLRSGGSVSIHKALAVCPFIVASIGDFTVTTPCVCVGSSEISIEALTLDVNADLSTEAGSLTLVGSEGLNINGATISTGTGTMSLTGHAPTGAGLTMSGAFIRSSGGDVDISASGPSAGLEVIRTDFILAGAANMFVIVSAHPDTAGTAFGARFAVTTFSTSSYVVMMNAQVDSLSGTATDPCVGFEMSNCFVSSLGSWNLDVNNACNVAAGNIGAQFDTVTMDYQLGTLSMAVSSLNSPAEGTIGLLLTSVVGSLPSFEAIGTASGTNPVHGLALDSVNAFIGSAILQGHINTSSGAALSAVSIVSSDFIIGGDLEVEGIVPASGPQSNGVVLDSSSITAASIGLDGMGLAFDAATKCGVCVSASSLTSFGETIILGNMHAFENDFGVNIDALSSIESARFQITGTVDESPNSASAGVFLSGRLSANDDSAVTGSISVNLDGTGLLITGGSLVSAASTAEFTLSGTTGASTELSSGVHLIDFEFSGTDSPDELLTVIGSTSSASPGDCIKIDGTTTLDGRVSFEANSFNYRPTRGFGIVVSGTVTSSSATGLSFQGVAAVSAASDPNLSVGVTIIGVVSSLQALDVTGFGSIGVVVQGSLTSLEGSVTIIGDADSSSTGTGDRLGATTVSSSLISAPLGSVSVYGTSTTHSGSILTGDISAAGAVTLRGVGAEDIITYGLSVDGGVVADVITMEGFGARGLECLGIIVASSVIAEGTSTNALSNGNGIGVLLSGPITATDTLFVTGSAHPVVPSGLGAGVVFTSEFELFPLSAAGLVEVNGSASGSNSLAIGIFWRRAIVVSNRDIRLTGTVADAVEEATGVRFFGDCSVSSGAGSLQVFGTSTGADAVGIEALGIFSSDTFVMLSGSLFAPAFGSGVQLGNTTRQADFTGTGAVVVMGDATESNGGIGVDITSDVTFGGAAFISGTGGCITGLDDNSGIVVGGAIASTGSLQLDGTGCEFGSNGNHGILVTAGQGITSGGSCSLNGIGAAMEGNNVGILFEAGTAETLVACDTIVISATELSEGDAGYVGTSFLHPIVLTSSSGVSLTTAGFVGMTIDADVMFSGLGPVVFSSVGTSVATAVEDGVVMTFNGPPTVLLQNTAPSDSFFLGVAVQIISDAVTFTIEGDISGDSLVFLGASTDVVIAELVLSRCEFTVSSVSLQAFDARAVFCGDVILNGFDVVSSESIDLQCGGTLTSSMDVGFFVDSFNMDSSYSIEGPVNVLINAVTEANFAGGVGLLESVASLIVQSSGYVRFSSTYISQGTLGVTAASLETEAATFIASGIAMQAADIQGSAPSLTAEGGLITLTSLGEFGASPLLTAGSADVDVQFFTGTIRALQSTILSLDTSSPSTGTVELNQFSVLMPSGALTGCITMDRLHMNDASLLVVDVAQTTLSGECNTDLITVSTEVALQGNAEVVFNTSFNPLVRGESYTFIDSPLTTNVFTNPPTMAGGFAATVVYGGSASAARAILGAGDVSLVINQLPVTVADNFSTLSTVTLVVPAPGVLFNDFDPDMTSLTVVQVSTPTFGVLTSSPDGSFSWDPQGIAGVATFFYVASDGLESSPQTAVTLLSTLVVPSPIHSPTATQLPGPSQSGVAVASVTASSVTRTPTRSPLVSTELVGPTPVPASPNPMPSPSRSSSAPPSVTTVDYEYYSTDDDPVTTTVLVPSGEPVPISDPATGEPIATVDVKDPMGGVLVVVVLPADERDVVSDVLDIQFFVDGKPVTSFEDGIEICFPARDSNDACLGFFNSSGDWECEDYCLEVDDDSNSACGVTHHLTNFALLLDGEANSDSKCGTVDNDYVILYISAAMGGCCCLFVVISVVAIEIKIRHKKYKVTKELDSIARQTSYAQSV